MRTGAIELQKWKLEGKKIQSQSIRGIAWYVCNIPTFISPLWSHDNNAPYNNAPSESIRGTGLQSAQIRFCSSSSYLNDPAWYPTVLIWLNWIICPNQCLSVVGIMSQKLSIDFNLSWTRKHSLNSLSNVSAVNVTLWVLHMIWVTVFLELMHDVSGITVEEEQFILHTNTHKHRFRLSVQLTSNQPIHLLVLMSILAGTGLLFIEIQNLTLQRDFSI